MSQYFLKYNKKNRLKQKGLLRRFSIDCYGEQDTKENLRVLINKELKNKKGTKEFECCC